MVCGESPWYCGCEPLVAGWALVFQLAATDDV
jgi:hypothetical protein